MKKLKMVFSFVVILAAISCHTAGAEQKISNGVLSLGICNRDAGAVCSITYGGLEFVNDYDHGRQLQIAWSYNDLGEAYNPTESGSAEDGRGRTSTSRLAAARVNNNALTTESQPAFWKRPGKGVNTQLVTNDSLEKKITLGYGGDPNVIAVDATITISPVLTGPPISKIRVEAPAFYTNKALTQHYQLDLQTGNMTQILPAKPDTMERMNERMRLNPKRQLIPIMSSPDGRYAVGVYTPQPDNFWVYSSYVVPARDASSACSKVTVRFQHPAEAGRAYSYRTFVIIGDLETVKNSAMKLPR